MARTTRKVVLMSRAVGPRALSLPGFQDLRQIVIFVWCKELIAGASGWLLEGLGHEDAPGTGRLALDFAKAAVAMAFGTGVRWDHIVVAGLSQGGGMAAIIGHVYLTARVVMFAAITDAVGGSTDVTRLGWPPTDSFAAQAHTAWRNVTEASA